MGDKMQRVLLVVLTYSLWLASGALSLWTTLWIRVLVLIDVPMFVLRVNPWVLRAINSFGTFALGLVWLIFIVASESYFRRLVEQQLSAISVTKVFIAEALTLGMAYGGHLLIG